MRGVAWPCIAEPPLGVLRCYWPRCLRSKGLPQMMPLGGYRWHEAYRCLIPQTKSAGSSALPQCIRFLEKSALRIPRGSASFRQQFPFRDKGRSNLQKLATLPTPNCYP
jgi:hypothetical protein